MITLKNSKIDFMFQTLSVVDRKSKELDFSIRFKNKSNYKLLKEAYEALSETINEIYTKYGKTTLVNGRPGFKFLYKENDQEIDNRKIVADEVEAIHELEVELELKPVEIICTVDKNTGKTDTRGLVITSDEMEILEGVFQFECIEK